MDIKKVIKVFVASPMDLETERAELKGALAKVNNTIGKGSNIEFEMVGWEDYTTPGFGDDAQDVVNQQISMEYDIFVCMFKSRLGTPTKRYTSGTVEEYERAKHKKIYRADLDIMAYFFECEDCPQEILDLKRQMGHDGALFWEVKKTDVFEDVAFKHFANKAIKYIEENLSKQPNKREENVNKIKNAVSVAIVHKNDVLIVRRSESAKIGPGLWQLPGGKVEEEERLEETAIREIEEELGYSIPENQLTKIKTFSTCLNNDASKPFEMSLFIHKVSEKIEIQPNNESSGYEWVSLNGCAFGDKSFLGINKQMLTVVWREVYLTAPLRGLCDYFRCSQTNTLPQEIPATSVEETNRAYVLLSLLGVVDIDNKITWQSSYSKMILEEIVSILSSGESIFSNDNNALLRGKKLSIEDMKQLKTVREQAFYSNKALSSVLSCKAELPNNVRRVCDTLLFGSYNDKKYLLLRWDFYANKYQIICKGIDNDNALDFREKAQYVINKRLPGTNNFFDMEFIKSCDVYHFSAGSIKNDPILRKYLIDVILLQGKKKYEADILRAIQNINEETACEIDFSYEINQYGAIDLKYYVWCDLEELIKTPNYYRGAQVRGVDEIIKTIGASVLRELSYRSIELSEDEIIGEELERSQSLFKEKYRGN